MSEHVEIPLTQGKVALIDLDDAPGVLDRRWHAKKSGRAWVAEHSFFNPETGRVQNVLMHRFILRPPRHLVVDHINGDPLDNRRANLRVCTHRENSLNSRAKSGSPYKGVVKIAAGWRARIEPNRVALHLGTFDDETFAAAVYNRAAAAIFGDFSRPNDVPDISDDEWVAVVDAIASRKKQEAARLEKEFGLIETLSKGSGSPGQKGTTTTNTEQEGATRWKNRPCTSRIFTTPCGT